MTPQEIKAELDAISKIIGPQAYVTVGMTSWTLTREKLVEARCYFDSAMKHQCSASGDTFEEAFTNLRAEMESHLDKASAATIRKLALAIITTTADLGECSDAALRGNGFSQDEIDQHGEAACSEATRMAAGGPFEIVRHNAFANAAE